MHTIYRIEDANGDGPYRGTMQSKYGSGIHRDGDHPNLYTDMPMYRALPAWASKEDTHNFHCAFASRRAITKWFTGPQLVYLINRGFTIKKIRVKKIIVGLSGRQVFYRKEDVIN